MSEQRNREEELLSKIDRASKVINGIPGNEAIQILFEDLAKTRETIDNNWHLVVDEKKLQELRVTKLAIGTLLSIVQSYEHDYKLAQKELEELRNKKHFVGKDYDTEGV